MIGDNFTLFDREDARLARAETKAPKCDLCGEAIYDYGYRISCGLSDLFICEPCMEQSREYVEED